ncbi:MAG: hypothetical protein WA728_32190, partial [Xanthobacteraceae bacterium]
FRKGDNREKGRPAGAQNKTTRILKEAMLLAAEQVGDLSGIKPKDLSKEGIEKGKDGLVGYLRWAAKCESRSFMAILGRLLPMQVKVDSFTQTVYRSVEEIQRDMERRGLNIRSFGQLLLDAHRVGKDQFDAREKDQFDAREKDSNDA